MNWSFSAALLPRTALQHRRRFGIRNYTEITSINFNDAIERGENPMIYYFAATEWTRVVKRTVQKTQPTATETKISTTTITTVIPTAITPPTAHAISQKPQIHRPKINLLKPTVKRRGVLLLS
jgi:hypothetical protein